MRLASASRSGLMSNTATDFAPSRAAAEIRDAAAALVVALLHAVQRDSGRLEHGTSFKRN